jgi:hypothetical protein
VIDGLETEALRRVQQEMAQRPPTVYIPLSLASEFIDSATAAFALGRLTNPLEVWPAVCHFTLAQLCASCEACITRSPNLAHKCRGEVDAYLLGRYTLICRLFRIPGVVSSDPHHYTRLRSYLHENTHPAGTVSPPPLIPAPQTIMPLF